MALGRRPTSRRTTQVDSMPNSPGTEGTTTRNVRGRAANNALDAYLAKTGQKARVEFKDGLARPVGKWSKEFTTEIGIVSRMFAPFSCNNWRNVDNSILEQMHEHLLKRFDVDLHIPRVKEIVNKFLGGRLKGHRCRLHGYYKRLGNGVHKRQNPPKSLSQESWDILCSRFESEAFQKLSEKNSENREKLPVNHRGGSKPFVRYREEQRDTETEQECGRIELYRLTHFKESKGWISQIAADNYDQMIALKNQPVVEGSTELTDDQIVDHVLGKRRGYTRGLGNGMLPPSSSSSCYHPEMEDFRLRAETAEKHNEELVVQVHDQGVQLQELKTWQEKMDTLLVHVTNSSAP